jgi:hypothetical protein
MTSLYKILLLLCVTIILPYSASAELSKIGRGGGLTIGMIQIEMIDDLEIS